MRIEDDVRSVVRSRHPIAVMRLVLSFALLTVLAAACASRVPATHATLARRRPPRPMPTPESLIPALDTLVDPLVRGDWVAGVVVGIVSGDRTIVRGYGHARDGGPAPDENTVFEIGSVTKTFTALGFADMISRHEVAIDTTVASLLPDGVAIPSAGDRPMLLVDLATHLSGLPRLPPSFRPRDLRNPYADFHDAELLAALRETTLAAAPGSHYEYSNYGYGLLGWLLARREHTSYEHWITSRICTPLGLADTSITLSDSQRSRFAQGHDADGDPAPPWDQDASAGAGAIRSTAHDMLGFLRAQLDPQGALADAIVRAHSIRYETASPPGYVAMGWHLWRDRHTYWHNGGTGGFHSYVAFDPREGIGVVVLANTESARIDTLGTDAVRLLRGQTVSPIELPASIALDDARLERYVGEYEIAPGVRFLVTHTPGALRAQLANQPAIRIHAASEAEFYYRVVDARLTFEFDAAGRAAALTLHQNGRDLRFLRVDSPAP